MSTLVQALEASSWLMSQVYHDSATQENIWD